MAHEIRRGGQSESRRLDLVCEAMPLSATLSVMLFLRKSMLQTSMACLCPAGRVEGAVAADA